MEILKNDFVFCIRLVTTQEFFSKLEDIENILNSVKNSVDPLHSDIQNVKNTIDTTNNHLQSVISENQTSNSIQNSILSAVLFSLKQNKTIICNLEKISNQTCMLLNESHTQTSIIKEINEHSADLTEMYKTTHSDSALELCRQKEMQKKIEECCPPKEPEPICRYEPCEGPGEFKGRTDDVRKPVLDANKLIDDNQKLTHKAEK